MDLDMSVYSYYTERTENGENNIGAAQQAIREQSNEEGKFDGNTLMLPNTENQLINSARNDVQIFADLETTGPREVSLSTTAMRNISPHPPSSQALNLGSNDNGS